MPLRQGEMLTPGVQRPSRGASELARYESALAAAEADGGRRSGGRAPRLYPSRWASSFELVTPRGLRVVGLDLENLCGA
jgi:hypothetical protein